ncbi:MAG: hypothetical protein M3094_08025, partial [Actinomycetia bacterium]|nr:hypothetical protein [Actinomycetes bacterium]
MTDERPDTWGSERVYEILRMPIRLASTDERLGLILDRICEDFDPSTEPPITTVSIRSDGDGYTVWAGETRKSDVLDFDQSVMKLMSTLHREAMKLCDLWSVHAGVVSRNGRAVAFPGISGVGKSTLAGACVAAGWEYVSDEALSFDPDTMEVVLYPKPIWMDGKATRSVGLDDSGLTITPDHYKYPVTPRDLGGRVADGPIRLAHLILIERSKEDNPRIEPLRPAELVTLLL